MTYTKGMKNNAATMTGAGVSSMEGSTMDLRALKVGDVLVAPSGKTYRVIESTDSCSGWYIGLRQVGGKTDGHHSFYERNPGRCGKGWTLQAVPVQ